MNASGIHLHAQPLPEMPRLEASLAAQPCARTGIILPSHDASPVPISSRCVLKRTQPGNKLSFSVLHYMASMPIRALRLRSGTSSDVLISWPGPFGRWI